MSNYGQPPESLRTRQFDYALRSKGARSMIAIVMEPRMRNPGNWKGQVGGKLGGKLYIDLSEDGPLFEVHLIQCCVQESGTLVYGLGLS